MNILLIAQVLFVVGLLAVVTAIALITFTLITGSYEHYAIKRDEHIQQLRRVQDEIRRSR